MAKVQGPVLEQMSQLNQKATIPGVAIGRQLSPEDQKRFNDLRHLLIQMQAEQVKYSQFERDVHVIAGVFDAAELADLYEVKRDALSQSDPRRFYFTILDTLRIAEPKTFHTDLIKTGIDCDPEGGLYFEESYDQRQLADAAVDQQHLVNLIADIERLRTLYQVVWNAFNKGIDDIRATTWQGDQALSPDAMTPFIDASSTPVKQIWKTIIPYIDKEMPSKQEFEGAYQVRFRQQVEQEFPSKK